MKSVIKHIHGVNALISIGGIALSFGQNDVLFGLSYCYCLTNSVLGFATVTLIQDKLEGGK